MNKDTLLSNIEKRPPGSQKKLFSLELAAESVTRQQAAGRKIVFTNGCFDLMHAGHVRYLIAARMLGDILIVGLNSNHSVVQIKGPRRPLHDEILRAEVLAALWCVDLIVLFSEPDPLNVIQRLKPDVLVKGADWDENEIIGADFVKKRGGRVATIPLVKGLSTTTIIKTIVSRYTDKGADDRDQPSSETAGKTS